METTAELRTLEALRVAVRLIRRWHCLGICSSFEPKAWGAYYRHASEMAPIREVLGPAGEELK